MKKKLIFKFVFLFIIFSLSALIVWPKGPDINFSIFGIKYHKELKLNRGLDLQGGTQLTYELEVQEGSSKSEAQEKAITVIRNRVDAFGVAEPVIYPEVFGDSVRIIIQLPGISDMDEAVSLIGKTAQLNFKEQKDTTPDDELSYLMGGDWKEDPVITGGDLKRASVERDETGAIEISLEFTGEGAKKFAEATKRNLGKQIAIFLDDELLTAPVVQSEITDGRAKITGDYSLKEAKNLAIQLNAGALPVPMELVEQQNVGATLGEDSINSSFLAALVGFLAITIFLISFYRVLGLLNILSLVVYSLITVAIFKLTSITLTLAGIAGFILSAGAAAEASVLVLERIREEIRKGLDVEVAIEAGFRGAWPSIKDSNIISFILAAIVFYLGTGLVKGFGVTLAIGVSVSLITIWIVDRPLLQFLARRKIIQNKKLISLLFGLSKKEIK